MIPGPEAGWVELGRAYTASGEQLLLRRRDQTFELRMNGRELMSTRAHASEEAMARLACARLLAPEHARVLIGGLGFGYTLRAALDALPATASVTVAELLAEIVVWNRGELAPLAGFPLNDARVTPHVGDVAALLRASPVEFDAILLDIDNGPDAPVRPGNAPLCAPAGLCRMRRALRPSGVLAIWSAHPVPGFVSRLRDAGFAAASTEAPAHERPGAPLHTIFLGTIAGE